MTQAKQAYLVYNPAAGQVDKRALVWVAAVRLEAHGWQIQVEETRSGADTSRLAQDAAQKGHAAFFIAGGDGSVGQAAAGLVGSRTALGVLPGGTANVWARELGLRGLTWWNRRALEDGAERLARGRVHAVDVGLCNGRAFLLWAGLGLDAIIVAQMETPRRGRRRFALAKYLNSLFWNARRWGGMDLTVQADGERREGHYLLAVISNIRSYAGGISSLSPQAVLDDGEMELWLFSGDNMRQSLLHALRLLSGLHVRSSQIVCLPFRRLQIASNDQLALQLDGEPDSIEGALNVEVRHAALRVLAPEGAPSQLFKNPPLASSSLAGEPA